MSLKSCNTLSAISIDALDWSTRKNMNQLNTSRTTRIYLKVLPLFCAGLFWISTIKIHLYLIHRSMACNRL